MLNEAQWMNVLGCNVFIFLFLYIVSYLIREEIILRWLLWDTSYVWYLQNYLD